MASASVAEDLEAHGISTSLISVPTLKPLDIESLTVALQALSSVSVIEECAPRALGLEVEALANRVGFRGYVGTFSLRDEFIHCYGSHQDVLVAHGLSIQKIVSKLRRT